MNKISRQGVAAILMSVLLTAAAAGQESFDAAADAGRLALDTGRFEEAADIFRQAAAIDPAREQEIALDWGWAYLRLGYVALARSEWQDADSTFSAAVEHDGRLAELFAAQWAYARLRLAWSSIEQVKDNHRRVRTRPLVDEAESILQLMPDNRGARYLLGWLYEYENHGEAAKNEYRAAIGGNPSGSNMSVDAFRKAAYEAVSASVTPFGPIPVHPGFETVEPGDFKRHKTAHFEIIHRNAALARRLGAAMEYYMSTPVLAGVLAGNARLGKACIVTIFPTKEEFTKSTGKPSWVGGEASFRFVGDEVTAQIDLYQGNVHLMESTVPHELAHVRFAVSSYYDRKLPPWIQEGISVAAETAVARWSWLKRIDKAREDGTIATAEELMAQKDVPDDGHDLFYAEAYAAVSAIVEAFGVERFEAFLGAVRHKPQEEALMEVYGMRSVDFEDVILGWLGTSE